MVYLVEDDYFHHASAVAEMLGVFASHDPCFVAPYDYADRYWWGGNRLDGKVTVLAGQAGPGFSSCFLWPTDQAIGRVSLPIFSRSRVARKPGASSTGNSCRGFRLPRPTF